MTICERCQKRFDDWRVTRAELRVGMIHRLPQLCQDCSALVEIAVINALQPSFADALKALGEKSIAVGESSTRKDR